MFEVERAGNRIVSKAAQLISNNTTNLSECYMSIRAKMDGGKQINRIQSGSFEHRCKDCHLHLDQHGLKLPGKICLEPVLLLLQNLSTNEKGNMKTTLKESHQWSISMPE